MTSPSCRHHHHHYHHHYYYYPPQPASNYGHEFGHYPAPPSAPPLLHPHGGETFHDLSSKPSYKVYCKANPNFHLAIRDGEVVLARADPNDPCQNWFKDDKHSARVKDEQGYPCFSLVNKATGLALKHSGDTSRVQLVAYNESDVVDQSVLWSLGRDEGGGFRAMRMASDIHLNVDACRGNKECGGVRDGTTIVLWQWNQGRNQQWKIVPQ
ncbi:unnamed protein product [Linum trigynum]|uniref:Uncharacterized protein n=1 Tax=Linum trigynum TaxID=586398 RepID=A0AAV2CA43_9ROSI